MLAVKSLTIEYGKRVIFDNVNIEFKRGTITVIQGKSGSGKSSFLNILGLMQTASKCEYTFDNTLVSNFSETERADFRLHNVGFVFQQSNLIQELTAKENLIVPMSITGQGNNIEEKAEELIKYVGLEEVKNSYPGSLSGGEEQRLAIARAIANDADIILADEPTASLDAENSKKVLELFSRLAHELNKIVILVSHSEFVPKYADVICEIKDKDLVVTKTAVGNEPKTVTDHSKVAKKRNVSRFVRYYTKKRSGDKVLNRVFVAVTAVVAAAAILSTNFGANFAASQQRLIDLIADRSILVVNNISGQAGQVDYEEALVISPDVINQIGSITNVSSVYPWYSFFSSASSGYLSGGASTASVKVANGRTVDRFTVCPLYEEEYEGIPGILEHKSGLDLSSGVILSNSLASKLTDNPADLIDKDIEITCFVPTKVEEGVQTVMGNEVLFDKAYYKSVTIRRTVTGVLQSTYSSQRTRETDVVFMNYNQLMGVVNQNKDMNLGENQRELGPSALVVFVDTSTNASAVASRLMIPPFPSAFSVMQNDSGVHAGETLETTRTIMTVVTIVFVGIIAVMFSLLYHLKNRPRKKEFGILKAMGFTKSNIVVLTAVEMLRVALPAFVISIVLSLLIMVSGNGISGNEIFTVTLFSILVGMLVCVIVVVAAGMFPVYNAIKVDPIDAIRRINK